MAASRTGMALCTARFLGSESVCRRLHSTWLERPDRSVGRHRNIRRRGVVFVQNMFEVGSWGYMPDTGGGGGGAVCGSCLKAATSRLYSTEPRVQVMVNQLLYTGSGSGQPLMAAAAASRKADPAARGVRRATRATATVRTPFRRRKTRMVAKSCERASSWARGMVSLPGSGGSMPKSCAATHRKPFITTLHFCGTSRALGADGYYENT